MVLSYRKLSSVGVRVHDAHAGYYIFPDFEVIRDGLLKKSITTGQQMCDAIMKDISVSVSATYFLLTNDISASELDQKRWHC